VNTSVPAVTTLAYLVTASCFILGIKQLGSPATARRGNQLAAVGMLLAIITTLVQFCVAGWEVVVPAMVVGTVLGGIGARAVRMTAMPQMVALFNGMGAAAAALIAVSDFRSISAGGKVDATEAITILLSCLIGSISFTGSLVAFAKLQELMTGRPITYPLQKTINALILAGLLVLAVLLVLQGNGTGLLLLFIAGAALLGVLFVLPIGGADMPVIISLLNSFTGLAAAITGFVLGNQVLIVSGALVGASGTILTQLMSRAMNRSLASVLFGAFGQGSGATPSGQAASPHGDVRSATAEDVATLLAYAQQVVIVPGYGLAVARAQHEVKELADLLGKKGVTVKYAIHPVAGRMPGHMNVLLAEANVPYPQLHEMDEINPEFPRTDVAVVIGANDVVNPAARDDPGSPIYGMPILNVDQATTVVVLKRSMASGFAGIDNALFYNPRTLMLFGDARASVSSLVAEVKALK
jgi:NAD(P) transhydrogenase subunit beta